MVGFRKIISSINLFKNNTISFIAVLFTSDNKIENILKRGFNMLKSRLKISLIDFIGILCNLVKKSLVCFCYLNEKIL